MKTTTLLSLMLAALPAAAQKRSRTPSSTRRKARSTTGSTGSRWATSSARREMPTASPEPMWWATTR